MPIQDALQIANLLKQHRAGRFDSGHGSDQIFGLHLVASLRFEQAELIGTFRLHQAAECGGGASADLSQVICGQSSLGAR